jgi:hypothetical protein
MNFIKRAAVRVAVGALAAGAAAVAVPLAAQAALITGQGTSVTFSGTGGDFITQDQAWSYDPANSAITATASSVGDFVEVGINAGNGVVWTLDFAAPQGQPLTAGTVYNNATRYPFQPVTLPGLSFYGDGRGCNTLTGSFTVKNATFGPNGWVQTFDATFVQHCEESTTSAATGEVVIENGPAPSTVTLAASAPTVTYGDEEAETLTATVASSAGGTPTGTVTVADGNLPACSITLTNGTGHCTLPATALPAGTDQLTATYSGDANYLAASTTATITVAKAAYSGTIRLYKMGYCLDDRNNSSSNGAVVQVWRCNGLPSQRWQVMSDGTIRHNGLCLDAAGYGTANGTKVQLWACSGKGNQKWDTKGYRIHYDNPAATGKVLDDTGYGGNGTRQEIWANTGTVNQLWETT